MHLFLMIEHTNMPASTWRCVATLETEMPVNCLVTDPSRPGVLWYGMYSHHSDTHREGGIASWQFRGPQGDSSSCSALQRLPGVFDLMDTSSGVLLDACDTIVCCTDGSVRGMRRGIAPDDVGNTRTAMEQWTAAVDDEMITSCCMLGPSSAPASTLGCSAHLGTLAVMTRATDGSFQPLRKWQGHEFDAWCVASHERGDAETEGLMWTGGDDGMLALWDVRAPATDDATSVMRRRFDAGVVTIVTGETSPNELIVGSYDESLYVLDRRALKRPISSVSVGGGAWRCRPSPVHNNNDRKTFVVAAMQGGATIVEWDRASSALAVLEDGAEGTEGLLHSVDERPAPNGVEGVLIYDAIFLDANTIATSSFYNQTIKIWENDPK